MKKLGVIFSTLVICLCLNGCKEKANPKDDIVGVYKSEYDNLMVDFNADGKTTWYNEKAELNHDNYQINDKEITIGGEVFTYDLNGDDLTLAINGNSLNMERTDKASIDTFVSNLSDEVRILGYWHFFSEGSRFFLYFDETYGMKMKKTGSEWSNGSYFLDSGTEMIKMKTTGINLDATVGYHFVDTEHVTIGDWECERVYQDGIK